MLATALPLLLCGSILGGGWVRFSRLLRLVAIVRIAGVAGWLVLVDGVLGSETPPVLGVTPPVFEVV
jgi:hypothetical protein